VLLDPGPVGRAGDLLVPVMRFLPLLLLPACWVGPDHCRDYLPAPAGYCGTRIGIYEDAAFVCGCRQGSECVQTEAGAECERTGP
jgi:hypothetical protein